MATAETKTDQTAELLALAERCEAATSWDKQLDLAIIKAVGWSDERPYIPETDGWREPAHFTGSVDAAMTLAPEGWEWLVRSPSKDGPQDKGRHFARIESPDFEAVTYGKGETWITDTLSGTEQAVWAATPALALTAAALRARAQVPA